MSTNNLTARLTPKKLLKCLYFDSCVLAEDISTCLSSIHTMGPSAIDKAQWIAESPKVRTWLSGPTESRMLLIQGHRDPFKPGSPVSFFCAHLSNMLSPAKPVTLISHVCGMSQDFLNDQHNAKGMLVSLIGQLLFQRKDKGLKFDLSWMHKEDIKHLAGCSVCLSSRCQGRRSFSVSLTVFPDTRPRNTRKTCSMRSRYFNA